ncbi:MAG: anti-sigma factor family protein, partial [Gemmatimonadaceae bacterium]
MQHPEEGTLHAWLDGALDAADTARVDEHVASCAVCSAAVADARGFIAASSRILSALDDVPAGVIPLAPSPALARAPVPASAPP